MKSVNSYNAVCSRSPDLTIRIYPILLSLTQVLNTSGKDPDFSAISLNDERVFGNSLYTLPSALLPLKIHFLGQNGLSLFSNQNGHTLKLVDDCQECVAFAPQANFGKEDNATQADSVTTRHSPEVNLANINGIASSQESEDWEAEPSMFPGAHVQQFADYIHCLWHKRRYNPVKGLKNVVQVLKTRCDMLEKTTKDPQSICNTYQRTLETLRQQIITLHGQQGMLNLSYLGEQFEAIL